MCENVSKNISPGKLCDLLFEQLLAIEEKKLNRKKSVAKLPQNLISIAAAEIRRQKNILHSITSRKKEPSLAQVEPDIAGSLKVYEISALAQSILWR